MQSSLKCPTVLTTILQGYKKSDYITDEKAGLWRGSIICSRACVFCQEQRWNPNNPSSSEIHTAPAVSLLELCCIHSDNAFSGRTG